MRKYAEADRATNSTNTHQYYTENIRKKRQELSYHFG